MISYAQNFEDVMLRRVFRDRKDGFYIDIGAMDPVEDSVTKFFYDEGWSGINVEPNEYFYNRLLADRPRDINLKIAVGDRDEKRKFHVFEKFGNSTFDGGSRDSFASNGYESELKEVRVTTLAAICREYVKREVDFLKIDCEGWEKQVLAGADWERFRPTILIIEATEPGSPNPVWQEWECILTENNRYSMVYFDGLNRYYLRREYSDLRTYFDTPPNIFDAFTPRRAAVAEATNAACQQERTALAEQLQQLDGEISVLSRRSEELLTQVVSLQAEINAEQSAKKTLEDAGNANQERIARLGQELEHLTDERDAAMRREQVLSGQIAVQKEKSDHTVQALTSENSALKRELIQARIWIGQLSQDLTVKRLSEL